MARRTEGDCSPPPLPSDDSVLTDALRFIAVLTFLDSLSASVSTPGGGWPEPALMVLEDMIVSGLDGTVENDMARCMNDDDVCEPEAGDRFADSEKLEGAAFDRPPKTLSALGHLPSAKRGRRKHVLGDEAEEEKRSWRENVHFQDVRYFRPRNMGSRIRLYMGESEGHSRPGGVLTMTTADNHKRRGKAQGQLRPSEDLLFEGSRRTQCCVQVTSVVLDDVLLKVGALLVEVGDREELAQDFRVESVELNREKRFTEGQ